MGGDTLVAGDSVAIYWSHDPAVISALNLQVSVNNGPWLQLNRVTAVDPDDEVYYWNTTLLGNDAYNNWIVIRMENYADNYTIESDPFYLAGPVAVRHTGREYQLFDQLVLAKGSNGLYYRLPLGVHCTFYTLSGRQQMRINASGYLPPTPQLILYRVSSGNTQQRVRVLLPLVP
jgi:hypothetical protein